MNVNEFSCGLCDCTVACTTKPESRLCSDCQEKIINLFFQLAKHLEDVDWKFVGATDRPTPIELEDFKQQTTDIDLLPVEYVDQTQRDVDWFTGILLYPISDTKCLKITYST